MVDSIKNGMDFQKVLNITLDQFGEGLFIADMIRDFRYASSPADYLTALPFDFIMSLMPNMIKVFSNVVQVNKIKYDSGLLGDLEKLAATIPFVSYAFPTYKDPYTGKSMTAGKIPVITQALGFMWSDISPEEREAMELGLKYSQLKGEITIDGKKVKIDAEKANMYRGEIANKLLKELMNSSAYKNMDAEQKKKAFQSVMNKASDYGKIAAWADAGHKYYAGKEVYNTLKSLNIPNVYLGSGGYKE
jgi:hypothetical protein